MSGKIVETNYSADKINIENLPKGNYLIKIQLVNSETETIKFTKINRKSNKKAFQSWEAIFFRMLLNLKPDCLVFFFSFLKRIFAANNY